MLLAICLVASQKQANTATLQHRLDLKLPNIEAMIDAFPNAT